MFIASLIYLLLTGFILLVIGFWVLNFFGLPGNWLIIDVAALWIWLGPQQFQFSWWLLLVLLVMAVMGEVIEFAASVFGTKKMGGSSRGATLSVFGSIIGAIMGAVMGIPIPIPVVGILIGSILFAGIGAMLGAMIGEYWVGSTTKQTMKIGGAAFFGRMLGTVGKITIGSGMAVLTVLAPFLF